jgi:predicted amidohydrolase
LDPEHNFNKAANFIRSAASQGAELAVLPEYHLTNWLPKDPSFAGLCDQWETYLKKYQGLAKECGICIVPGTIVEGHRGEENEEDRLLNVCYFIGKEGDVVGKYVKKNLWCVALFIPPGISPLLHTHSILKSCWMIRVSVWIANTGPGAQSATT